MQAIAKPDNRDMSVMDIPFTPARQLARLLHARKISATEVMRAFIAQIERTNPQLNAVIHRLDAKARAAASRCPASSAFSTIAPQTRGRCRR